jgi:hypothetical protein
MIKMFGRELTLEQVKGFVQAQEKDGEVRIPTEWILDLIEKAQETEQLKDRLQISPQGDDKIDELQQEIEYLKFRLGLDKEIKEVQIC